MTAKQKHELRVGNALLSRIAMPLAAQTWKSDPPDILLRGDGLVIGLELRHITNDEEGREGSPAMIHDEFDCGQDKVRLAWSTPSRVLFGLPESWLEQSRCDP
ncbi:MAG: hypothetical protein AAF851_22040 [Myxococcota bacterium]